MKPLTVAIIGPDGAGKTTVAQRIRTALPRPVRYIYMGVNAEASNVALPTTRWLNRFHRARGAPPAGGPPDPGRRARPKGWKARMKSDLRSVISLTNRLAEEWFRQLVTWYQLGRGRIVLYDRHFYTDYYAHDIVANGRERSLGQRIHGFMLQHVYPKPDLVILLDAPAEVLWARKPEGTFAAVAQRRQEYLEMGREFADFAIVDATQPPDLVYQQVEHLILERSDAPRGR